MIWVWISTLIIILGGLFAEKINNSKTSLIVLIILISSFFVLKFALQKEKIYSPKILDNQIFTDFEVEELIEGKK